MLICCRQNNLMQLYFVIILALVAFTAADYTFPVYLDKEESYGYNARTYGKMLFNISSTETFDASFSQGSFIHRCVNTTHCVKHYDSSCLDSFEIIIFVVSNYLLLYGFVFLLLFPIIFRSSQRS